MGVLTLTAILQFWYSITSSNASPAHGQINDSAERNGHALSHPSAINAHPPARMRFSAYVTILGN